MSTDITAESMTELPKTYDPASVEPIAYQTWLDEKLFQADPAAPGPPYCIVIPPPNVTGALHLGHAINDTLQDILTRVHRMRGFNTLWVPGIDHAGIATQAVVEKQLKERENKTRHDVGREGLVQRIWQWKQKYGDRILEQLKRMGCSCDWSRTRFTLDEGLARAVRQTFFKLFKDGLVYRGKRLVNWDTHLQTSISDDEIYHEKVKTSLWHIAYEFVGAGHAPPSSPSSSNRNQGEACLAPTDGQCPTHVVVATTRPETMLGDTAVAVHSQDPRWNWAIGKQVKLPLTNRLIPIIADDILVDPEFGSGVVKVTPAHDPNDYAVYTRHLGKSDEIALLNILNPDGTLNENAGPYAGMKRDIARKKVVHDLTEQGLLVKEEPYETDIGHSDRSKTAIEPYLSDQWFVKMAPLAEPALEVVRNGTIKFFPERHAQQYLAWLGEKRDWPISRQLWWGHRIPVWTRTQRSGDPSPDIDTIYMQDIKGARVAIRTTIQDGVTTQYACVPPGHPDAEKYLQADGYTQDPDVLDTWFSSALWPHSTLGWPDDTPDLRKWYPTSVLLTGRDIITLWVARMVMMGMYNTGSATPSPGTPGEGRGEGSSSASISSSTSHRSPHPNPLPEYRERGQEVARAKELGIPFYHVAINPTILDGKGERMSKSKGNGVDPVDIIETHGADALRFTLTTMATETQDARMPVKKLPNGKNTSDKFDFGRNFCTKLWNMSRFALMNLSTVSAESVDESKWSITDRWLLSRLMRTVKECDDALAVYRFDTYAKSIYNFFWNDLCDWYVEAIKPELREGSVRRGQVANILATALDVSLRLMHPMIPFITETIWWKLSAVRADRGIAGRMMACTSPRLIVAAWPAYNDDLTSEGAELVFAKLQELITAIRNLRNEHKADPRQPVTVSIAAPGDTLRQIQANQSTIELLALCKIRDVQATLPPPPNSTRTTAAGCDVYVEGLVDEQAEQQRTSKRRDELTKQIAAMKGRLSNDSYTAKAPAHLVQQTRQQLAEAEAELAKLS